MSCPDCEKNKKLREAVSDIVVRLAADEAEFRNMPHDVAVEFADYVRAVRIFISNALTGEKS